ncbi:RNA polymerase sigma factor [Pseudaestuariivita atlantica]|uniref:RNA polymerase sigma-70 region 2 domain-containing protein n=1 Tax=Pseudaestuariivita atlantica TaxID=1317121 RepID=A0A0L1JS68_9RHOB|nr:sigma-70 family RNA polymerase sigma factor [Pseudaestuariivita atlantica]KNG94581.1 hypothetical protein ATO11_04015 [Pseudaestuariivita atlantica]
MSAVRQLQEPEAFFEDDQLGMRLIACRTSFLGFLMKRLGDRAEAEDVLQDFCVRVMSRTQQLREAERMDAWLYAVLRSVLNDHYRKNGRRRRLQEAVTLEMVTAEDCEDAPDEAQHICHCASGLLSSLRPADAELIQRIDLDGEDRSAVAGSLDVQPGTLNVRLHRARIALRDRLLDHCGCCCEDGFQDCSCPPQGCESADSENHCGDHG